MPMGLGVGGDQWGCRVLLMRPVALGRKLFLWRSFLVPMGRNLLPEGRDSNEFMSGVGEVDRNLTCSPQGPGGGVEVHHHCLWQVELLQLLSEVQYILCWTFLMMEMMFSSHSRSRVMAVPRKRKDSLHSVDWEVTQG